MKFRTSLYSFGYRVLYSQVCLHLAILVDPAALWTLRKRLRRLGLDYLGLGLESRILPANWPVPVQIVTPHSFETELADNNLVSVLKLHR